MKSTVRPLLPAAVAAFLSLGLAAATAGERMSVSEIEKTFSGITLHGIYFDGHYFIETYHEDGSIRYSDERGADSGDWSVKDGMFCTFYQGQDGACFVVERDGANCFTFFEPDPDAGGTAAEWTSRGWNGASEPTCPEPPEAVT